jgi:hypothetical protein
MQPDAAFQRAAFSRSGLSAAWVAIGWSEARVRDRNPQIGIRGRRSDINYLGGLGTSPNQS